MGSQVAHLAVRDGVVDRYRQGGGAGYGVDYMFAPG
jgi:hypothetical protein